MWRRASAAPAATAPVDTMPLMRQAAPLTMGWCLDCHRNPAPHLRPRGRDLRRPLVAAAGPGDARRGADRPLRHPHRAPDRLLGVPPMSGDLLSRRQAALGLLAAAMSAHAGRLLRKPEEEILPYVDQPETLTPGVPQRFATALPLDGYGRGVLCTAFEGRPVKIEGNPRASGQPRRHGRLRRGGADAALRPRPLAQPAPGRPRRRPGKAASPRCCRGSRRCGRATAKACGC